MQANSIVTTITDAFTGLLSGAADAVVGLFETLFVGAEGGISTFGIWTLAFIGVGAAMGIVKAIRGKVL